MDAPYARGKDVAHIRTPVQFGTPADLIFKGTSLLIFGNCNLETVCAALHHGVTIYKVSV